MCTLTFLPTDDGYLAGMNRDELLTRPLALPPAARNEGRTKVLHPREPSNGTWIACNSGGTFLALLNWHSIEPAVLGPKRQTRGSVIPQLIAEHGSEVTDSHFRNLSLEGIYPFRLVGVFLSEQALMEWCWDGRGKQRLEHPWERRHWFSSSLSDERAAQERGRVCANLEQAVQSSAENWLRKLHRSHEPEQGPFSI